MQKIANATGPNKENTGITLKRKSFFMHIIILVVSHVNMLLFSQFVQTWLGTVGHMPCIHPGNKKNACSYCLNYITLKPLGN